jgi:membrane-associated phospholipid phosphatase
MFTNNNVFNIHWLIAYSIGIMTIVLSIYGGYLFAKKSNNKNILNDVVFISIISIITMVLTMTIKEAMSRPRYTLILEMNDYNFFINWWENGHIIKSSVGENVISEYFKSFPSGHSAYSMFAIFIFPLLGNYNNVSKGKEMIFFILGIIWWILTAYSRITMGAHYLTDVCFGGMITLIGYLITLLIFKGKKIRQE